MDLKNDLENNIVVTEKERYEVSPLGLPKPAPKKVDFPMGKSHFFAKLSVLPAPEPRPLLRQICAKFAPNQRHSPADSGRSRSDNLCFFVDIYEDSASYSAKPRARAKIEVQTWSVELDFNTKSSSSTQILSSISPEGEREAQSAQGLVPRQACKDP